MQQNDPFNDLVMVDDLMLPVNSLPEYMQQMVKGARAQEKDIAFTYEDRVKPIIVVVGIHF